MMPTETSPRFKPVPSWIYIAIGLAGLFFIIGQYVASQPQRIQQEVAAERQLTIQGTGEAETKPDIAKIRLGVKVGPTGTAATALDQLAQKFNAVLAAVRSHDVKEDDIKTTNLSVNPVYDYTNGRQQLRGFEASEMIEIKIRDLSAIGTIISSATVEGVTQAGGISFESEDPNTAQIAAQEDAIEDANQKAEQLAKKLGVKLGRVKTFTSTTQTPGEPPVFARAEIAPDAAAGVVEVPPGTQTIRAEVTITYELH